MTTEKDIEKDNYMQMDGHLQHLKNTVGDGLVDGVTVKYRDEGEGILVNYGISVTRMSKWQSLQFLHGINFLSMYDIIASKGDFHKYTYIGRICFNNIQLGMNVGKFHDRYLIMKDLAVGLGIFEPTFEGIRVRLRLEHGYNLWTEICGVKGTMFHVEDVTNSEGFSVWGDQSCHLTYEEAVLEGMIGAMEALRKELENGVYRGFKEEEIEDEK